MATDASHDHGFNANKVFAILFVLTAVEVSWTFLPFPGWAHWGGLLLLAAWKGMLIFMYFMHMKFEGRALKLLIAPTVPLVAVVLFATMPDVAFNDKVVYPIGAKLDPAEGEVVVRMADLEARDAHGMEEAAAPAGGAASEQ